MSTDEAEQRLPTVAVVLISYNRPKMLDLAYASIVGADQIILADDGSDVFDAVAWSDARGIDRVVMERRSIDARMTTPSLGKMVNTALSLVTEDIVTYLCDDDLFAPGWIAKLRDVLPDATQHWARGRWRVFDDPLTNGEPLAKPVNSRPANLDWRKMTTGNFAHRIECYAECGLKWNERTIAVHDDQFLWHADMIHSLRNAKDSRVLAGWRREHKWNMAHYTAQGDYSLGAESALLRGALE